MPKRILITGGPGTGKTTIIETLKNQGFYCFDEISRAVTAEAQRQGIEQLFLDQPLAFSQKLLEGRTQQFNKAGSIDSSCVFYDRGLPDVLAYMDYIGDDYPDFFIEACKTHQYDLVFLLKPWRQIYTTDKERYESFDEALKINSFLEKTYTSFGYQLIEIPEESPENRAKFLLDYLNL